MWHFHFIDYDWSNISSARSVIHFCQFECLNISEFYQHLGVHELKANRHELNGTNSILIMLKMKKFDLYRLWILLKCLKFSTHTQKGNYKLNKKAWYCLCCSIWRPFVYLKHSVTVTEHIKHTRACVPDKNTHKSLTCHWRSVTDWPWLSKVRCSLCFSLIFSIAFTFSHLADAFIQSDLQMRTIEAISINA